MAGPTKDTEIEREKLLAEIARLTAEVDSERGKRTAAEEMAQSMAASNYAGSQAEEQPTGKTVLIRKCTNPWEKDEKKQKWTEVELPTYFYAIDLPAGASGSNGSCLATNGIEFHHGQVVELDPYMLSEVKSRVARCWEHEKSIHGDNENAYRKQTNTHLMTKAAAMRGAH